MPELPEVETTLRGVAPHIIGRTVAGVIVRQPRLRWPVPVELNELLLGQTLLGATRRGKYLLLTFAQGTLLIHLGMSGNLRIVPVGTPAALHDHVDIIFGTQVLRYHDPRRFGSILWQEGDAQQHALLAHLGPEPLSDVFDGEYLFTRCRKRTQNIKQFLMDSKVVVGVGNIYANEALYLAAIKPIRKAGTLSRKESSELVAQVKRVLVHAIEQGGTTLRDFVGGDGKPGYFKQQLLAYGRGGEPCVQCQKPLKETRLGQRTTVYCTVCQR
ncbi:bifunctional DNA-formamidopyrimidine glycosylase/DNA-(apurinic or apyrimidinic site) lyase [Gilvimarinus polysaccharolyticus]|uniref:bifunctional DNA-formamidopyrimidine glycosylase/DNA-(apurinic or apyrimidinic site) lyase n=1 Tax=Gilvimarinus polysaccharolyticus TaxID=863921 RepID=UPI0006737B0F|nr:bifunctional DNA-formamidopyrimidine glycosylase/DNA-(apurinic or apyrimidinic site) lyase [Gilvimarinus polysaccharolyticus]